MTRYINPLLILIMSCLLVACYSGKPLTSTIETTHSDTVTYKTEIIERDTVITVKSDSSTLDIDFDALLKEIAELKASNKEVNKTFLATSERSNLKLQLRNSKLTATCECTKEEYIIQLQEQLIHELKERKTTITETIKVPVKYVPPITKYMSILGWITIASGLGFGAQKILKPF